MAGEPGRGRSGANDDDSVLVAVVGLAWGCLVSVPAGHAAHAGLNVGGGKSERRECAEWNGRSRRGWGVRMGDGLR